MRTDLETGDKYDYRKCVYCKKRAKFLVKETSSMIRVYCSECGMDDEIIYKGR